MSDDVKLEPEVERVARAMFDAWPARAVSPHLAEMFGVPVNTPLTWENIIAGGGNHDGLIRLARAAVAALSTRNEALDDRAQIVAWLRRTAAYLEVQADVRYWEDALVDGAPDKDGTLIPFREGDTWHPCIDLRTGTIADWPQGLEADIHYKVCDAGEYWLTDVEGRRLAKWKGDYVPGYFLCHGDLGYGDYIIMKVSGDGAITSWHRPEIDLDEWEPPASPPLSTASASNCRVEGATWVNLGQPEASTKGSD